MNSRAIMKEEKKNCVTGGGRCLAAAFLIAHLSFLISMVSACSYDESLALCELQVQVVYEATTFAEPDEARVRVELKDQRAQVFVDSTGTDRVARFLVPPGIYEASTTASYVDSTDVTWWRYNFNGVRSMIVVSPDSLNHTDMQVRVSRRRIVH